MTAGLARRRGATPRPRSRWITIAAAPGTASRTAGERPTVARSGRRGAFDRIAPHGGARSLGPVPRARTGARVVDRENRPGDAPLRIRPRHGFHSFRLARPFLRRDSASIGRRADERARASPPDRFRSHLCAPGLEASLRSASPRPFPFPLRPRARRVPHERLDALSPLLGGPLRRRRALDVCGCAARARKDARGRSSVRGRHPRHDAASGSARAPAPG